MIFALSLSLPLALITSFLALYSTRKLFTEPLKKTQGAYNVQGAHRAQKALINVHFSSHQRAIQTASKSLKESPNFGSSRASKVTLQAKWFKPLL